MNKNIEYKTVNAAMEVKQEGDHLHITAYGCAFGNIDSWGDIIEPKACDKFLSSQNRDRCHLCYQHDSAEVIGKITDFKVDETGLLFDADILPTTRGKDAEVLIKSGALNEFSIGYFADKWHMDGKTRILEDITIVEISLVSRAANTKAVLLDVKSEEGQSAIKEMTDDQLKATAEACQAELQARENERIEEFYNLSINS